MAHTDWSWSQSYESPTLVATPAIAPHMQSQHSSTWISSAFNPNMNASVEMMEQETSQALPQQPQSQYHLTPRILQRTTNTSPPRRPILATRLSSSLLFCRKRSRDDSEAEDFDSSRTSPIRRTPSPPKTNRGEPIYGPGMTLIYPGEPGYVSQEGSQTGTWAEELAERLKNHSFNDRPVLEARKSMRLAPAAAGLDDISLSVLPEEISDIRATVAAFEEPVIDEATLALGISWTCVLSTPMMDAAARGWAKYIEGHFPLQSVKIVWQNKTLPAYLVSAVTRGTSRGHGDTWSQGSPGYYLFDEGLREGRLVAKSWERVLDCLKSVPMQFEGEEILRSETSSASDVAAGQGDNAASFGKANAEQASAGSGESVDVEMAD